MSERANADARSLHGSFANSGWKARADVNPSQGSFFDKRLVCMVSI